LVFHILADIILFDSPFRTWQTLAKTPDTWVVATKSYDLIKGGVLRFHIQGAVRGWQGFIFATNQAERTRTLNTLLSQLADIRYFSIKPDHGALAQLNLLHTAHPENPLINHQLVQMHFEMGILDRATALADTRIEATDNAVTRGLMHLLKGQITLNNNNWQSAELSLNAAMTIFSALKLPQLESLTLLEAAWIGYHKKDLRSSMQSLNMAASKGRFCQTRRNILIILSKMPVIAG
jgi:hypothetical protein